MMEDIMRINLKTNFGKKIVSKMVSKYLSKKTGCQMSIKFDSLDVDVVNGKTRILTNVEINFKNEDFKQILKGIDSEDEEF